MKLNEFTSEREQQKLDELLPLAALAPLAGAALRGGAALGGAALRGGAAAAKGIGNLAVKGAQAAGNAVKSAGQAASKAVGNIAAAGGDGEIGPVDIINAIKDPKVAQQLKALKQKMPGADLDAMVDPKAAQDQQQQIKDLDVALKDLKKNAGIK